MKIKEDMDIEELHNRGFIINHKTVRRLMKELELQCFVRAQKYKSYKGEVGKICDNLLNREFETKEPNQKWVTDVTEFKVHNEKLYLSPILDLFNGEVIALIYQDIQYLHKWLIC